MNESCGACRFFVRAEVGQPRGACRARPPVPMMVGVAKHPLSQQSVPQVLTFWPEVADMLWCGDFTRLPVGAAIDLSKLSAEELERA